MTATPRPADWASGQQVKIDAARAMLSDAQDREIMNRMADTTIMLRLHMWQTLIVQQNERVNRLYALVAKDNLWRHMLIGSTLNTTDITDDSYEDFPGDDAVERFIARLDREFAEIIRLVDEKLADIRTKYPDYRTYAWYGKVTGDIRQTPKNDFPGADSLEHFLRDLLARVVRRS